MKLHEMLKRMEESRVGAEASDLFWGSVSGTALKAPALIVVFSLLIFSAAALIFYLMPGGGQFMPCHAAASRSVDTCSSVSSTAAVTFAPSMCIMALGSLILVRLQKGRRFQASALSTAVLLLCSALSLARLGLGVPLFAVLLTAVFFSAYIGYRAAIRIKVWS